MFSTELKDEIKWRIIIKSPLNRLACSYVTVIYKLDIGYIKLDIHFETLTQNHFFFFLKKCSF